jgi:hypothetical protein
MLRKRGLRTEAPKSSSPLIPLWNVGAPPLGKSEGRCTSPTFGTGWTWNQTWTWNAARLPWRSEGAGFGATLHNLIYVRVGGWEAEVFRALFGRWGVPFFSAF